MALPELRAYWGNRSWIQLHRSPGRAGEVVSRSQRTYHWNCRWWLWRRGLDLCACGYSPDSNVGVLQTFAYLGIVYLVITMATGYFMQNPPDGWKPEGWVPSATETKQRAAKDYTLGGALKTWQWWALWLLLFLNTSAGISVISQESPMFQEIAKVGAVVAAGMVGVASIGNAVGRIFWAWISDAITRRWTFVTMFLLQVGLFWILPSTSSAAILTVLSFIVLMCYGGGFGTMPAFTADYFGSKNVGPIYGLMLTAWGIRECLWPLAHRAYATKQRFVCKRSPRDRRHRGGIHDFAHPGVAAQIRHGSEQNFEPRDPSSEFQMNSCDRPETCRGQGCTGLQINQEVETDRSNSDA